MKSNGLTVRPDDCPVTRTVRAALYATSLNPTEDDVIGIVAAIKEDGPDWHDRPTEKRGLWAVLGPNTNDFCTEPRHLTAHDIDIYIERGCRFFGPIPPDLKGT